MVSIRATHVSNLDQLDRAVVVLNFAGILETLLSEQLLKGLKEGPRLGDKNAQVVEHDGFALHVAQTRR